MNKLFLEPNDLLFFRDGRPMEGGLSGHGATWPTPNVVNHALHAAMHRAEFQDVHSHRRTVKPGKFVETEKKFGSLVTAGPFPTKGEQWFFPRPADALNTLSHQVLTNLTPINESQADANSLPPALKSPVANTQPPTKDEPAQWWSKQAWESYLKNSTSPLHADDFKNIDDFTDQDHNYGIEIDPKTGTVIEGQFYSANYLRLHPHWKLGVLAKAKDKGIDADLIEKLFQQDHQIVTGGQQRVCTVERQTCDQSELPLPQGMSSQFEIDGESQQLLKWVTLSPSIWPRMEKGQASRSEGSERNEHSGGWLPNWIDQETGKVLLRSISKEERTRRRKLNYAGRGYGNDDNAATIDAELVAAITHKPIVVTGYGLPVKGQRQGAKATHLAVPAGAVYYFRVNPKHATRFANALNWHGDTTGTEIRNRRSTLYGEKGYGLGVCGTWNYLQRP